MAEITFRSLWPDQSTPPPLDPHEQLLPDFNPLLPPEFVHGAEEAAEYISALDQNPLEAIREPHIKTFVQELGGSGFVGWVKVRHSMGGPDPRSALPAWLQTEFLETHGLSTPQISEIEMQEAGKLFDEAVGDKPYFDSTHGRYYGGQPLTSLDPRQFKYYIESQELLGMLRDNKLDDVLGALHKSGSGPKLFKLFEEERLVLYFDESADGDEVRNTLADQGIAGRGPSQDVFKVTEEDGQLYTKDFTSNDVALGDGGRIRVEYTAGVYDSRTFLRSYLELCLFAGKNPAEPYKTSFVYLLTPDGTPSPDTIDAAERFTHYPVVPSVSRHALTLTA